MHVHVILCNMWGVRHDCRHSQHLLASINIGTVNLQFILFALTVFS